MCHPLLVAHTGLVHAGLSRGELLQDVFYTTRWEGRPHDPAFQEALRLTRGFVGQSRAASTLDRYAPHWRRFTLWCTRFGVRALPAKPLHIAMFLAQTLQYALEHGLAYGVVKAASASIFQAHTLAGFSNTRTDHPIVKAIRSAAMRRLGLQPKNRKEPVSLQLCMQCARRLSATGASLFHHQLAVYIMICFAGFLRYHDATNIFADGVRFYPTHMEVFIEKRKTLQFRQGDIICIARGLSEICPVRLLELFFDRTGLWGKHVPVFQQASYLRSFQFYLWGSSDAWHYTQARKLTIEALASTAGAPVAAFGRFCGLQSLRSGGASHVAAKGVKDHVFQMHGGWADARSMLRYIKRSLAGRLRPTAVMDY